jgi:hypothetical protein
MDDSHAEQGVSIPTQAKFVEAARPREMDETPRTSRGRKPRACMSTQQLETEEVYRYD